MFLKKTNALFWPTPCACFCNLWVCLIANDCPSTTRQGYGRTWDSVPTGDQITGPRGCEVEPISLIYVYIATGKHHLIRVAGFLRRTQNAEVIG